MPENQSRPRQFLDGKQIQLLPEHAMVAFFGLFLRFQKIVEVFLGEKGRPVNPLELGVLLVSQPIGAGNIQEFESLDLPGRRNVRAPAEVRPVL